MPNKTKYLFDNVVYSTNPDVTFVADEPVDTPPPQKQKLRVSLERKGRGGKQVTLVSGFVGNDDDLETLGKSLKTKCGTGGSAKDGVIIIQGDCRSKVGEYLSSQGYNVKVI